MNVSTKNCAFGVALLLGCTIASSAQAQSSGGNFTITSQVVVGGGCAPNGGGGCTPSLGSGNLSLEGTIGEPGVANLLREPPYSLRAGFWYTTAANNTPTAAYGVVSGKITDSQGSPVAGAVLNLSGAQSRKTITDTKGNYRFDNVETTGFYIVTPARVNYLFSPSQQSFSQLGNHTEAAFTAAFTGDAANPLDTAEYFVRQQYVDILGREPDEGGFNYWSSEINRCGSEVACADRRRIDIAAAFFIEQEFQQSGSYIYNLYSGALGRKPRYTEYAADRRHVLGGVNLEAEKAVFAERFVQRREFMQRYQTSTTAESFVDALLQTVQQSSRVDLSSARISLLSAYNRGADLVTSRSQVLRSVAENAAFKEAGYNAAFVLTEYFGYLRREAEPEGYDFWLNVLNNREAGDFRGMVCSFITSTEYQKRFSSVVTHSNAECRR